MGFVDDVVKVGCSVSYNITDSSVFVKVTSWFNQTDVFERAVVKNSGGQVLASASFVPIVLPAYGAINLTINLDSVILASGQSYHVELHTADGKFYSSVLYVYENVKTRVSLVSANTLLVDVQSFANQTIVFERATISDWFSNRFNEVSTGLHQGSVDTTLSQTKLLPNENLSFTIMYEQGFSLGNYTIFLYSSSPESQYVGGAYAFFTVNGLEACFNRVATIERIAFDDVDNSTLLVDVQSLSNETTVFTDATFKERRDNFYVVTGSGEPSSTELPPYGKVTIAIIFNQGSYANSPLSFRSGIYTLTLYSGGNAVWAPFTMPLT